MTPLVLLPGMMCDAQLFAPQIAHFSAFRAVHCAPVGQASTMEQIAFQVLADAPSRFALAGLSMGGIVAMEIVRLAPDRVERLCLLDTNHLAETEERQSQREPQIKAIRDGRLDAVMRDEMKPNYLFDGPRKATILDICMDMARALGPEVFERQSRALQSRRNQTETLQAYLGKTLILCGRHDILCTVSRHEEMASMMPNASLAIVEEAGHMPTLEQPRETNRHLSDWLND
ncbi:MAG: alpha/beta hydrolase [Pseudomonadota bacterium]